MDVRFGGIVLGAVFLLFGASGCGQSILGNVDIVDIVDTTDWSPTISVSLAMATLDSVTPDTAPEPDPDPAKCPCKGTGVITHGDGHKTPCPYHGEDSEPDVPHRCQCDTRKTYCNCVAAYGKCSCNAEAAGSAPASQPSPRSVKPPALKNG
jgi:hypothetical protein